jgi:Flp pilus assembly protein TadD
MRALLRFSVVPFVLLFAATAFAAKPRVVVAFDESVDGKPAGVREAEASVVRALTNKGYRVISGEIAEQVRKAQAADFAADGKVPEALSAIDAEFILLGKIASNHFGSLDAVSVHSYRANGTAYVVRVDTAEIVATLAVEGKGESFGKKAAASSAVKDAGDDIGAQVLARLAALENAPKVVDVTLYGVPDRAANKVVKAAMQSVEGIDKVTTRTSARGISKLELEVSADTETLGDRLEGEGLPFEVLRTSPGAILLRFDRKRGLKLGLVVPPPSIKLGKGHRWLKRAVPELFASEMENMPFLDTKMVAAKVPAGRRQGKAAKRIAKRMKSHLVLATEVIPGDNKQIILVVKLYDAKGKKLMEATESGPAGTVQDIIHRVTGGMADAVFEKVGKSKDRALIAASKIAAEPSMPMPAEAATIRVGNVKLESIFPVMLERYRTKGAGEVQIALDGDAVATDVRVKVFIPGYMSLPTEVNVAKLKGSKTVPVKLVLDAPKVLGLDENVPAQAEVLVEARIGGAKATDKRVVPVMLYGRNSLDWTGDAPISAFVTPQEQTVVTMARNVVKTAVDAPVPSSLKSAILLHQAMSAGGFKYVKDPVRPAKGDVLDTVQFARETLKYRTGDCDDLSVLYASLLESVGVETAIILLPGHVLVGVAPGTGVDGVGQVTVDPDRYVVHEDRVFLPIETTMVGKRFSQAWDAGAKEVARWRKQGKVEVLITRAGWLEHPPAPLPKKDLGGKTLVASAKTVTKELAAIEKKRGSEIKKRKKSLSATVAKAPGGKAAGELAWLLAQTGDLEGAEKTLRAAVKASPKDSGLRTNLGNTLLLRGESYKAIGAYRRAAKDAPDGIAKGNLYGNLGVAYYLVGDAKQAQAAFQAAAAHGARSLALEVGADESGRAAEAKARTVAERDIQSLLLKALAEDTQARKTGKRKKERFKKALASGGRRGDDPESRRRLVDLLRWSR